MNSSGVYVSGGIIPLPPGPVYVAAGLAAQETTDRLAGALRAAGRPATTVASDARGSAKGAIVVPIGAVTGEDPSGRDRVHEITLAAAQQGPTVAVAVDVPYSLASVAEGCACVAVYGTDPPSLKAAAEVLAGTIRARGRLPVTVR